MPLVDVRPSIAVMVQESVENGLIFLAQPSLSAKDASFHKNDSWASDHSRIFFSAGKYRFDIKRCRLN